MAVLHAVHGKLPLIPSHLFADTVGDIGLLQKGAAFLSRENDAATAMVTQPSSAFTFTNIP